MLNLFIHDDLLYQDKIKFSAIGGDAAAHKNDEMIYMTSDCRVLLELLCRATTWDMKYVRYEVGNIFHQIRREILSELRHIQFNVNPVFNSVLSSISDIETGKASNKERKSTKSDLKKIKRI